MSQHPARRVSPRRGNENLVMSSMGGGTIADDPNGSQLFEEEKEQEQHGGEVMMPSQHVSSSITTTGMSLLSCLLCVCFFSFLMCAWQSSAKRSHSL